MSLLRLRSWWRRPKRRVAVALAMIALLGAVSTHHAVPTHMDGMAAAAVCLAVTGLGVTVAVARGTLAWLPTSRPLDLLQPLTAIRVPAPLAAPARAGPLFLRLSVLRR